MQLSIVLLETPTGKGSVLPPALSLIRKDKVRDGRLTAWARKRRTCNILETPMIQRSERLVEEGGMRGRSGTY